MNEDITTRKVAYAVYTMYLAGIVLPMLPILGVIFAYIFENDARDILPSHYQQLIRTFWIGLLYFGLSALFIPILIGFPLLTLSFIWWIIRNVKGVKSLLRNEPISNPRTWLF